MLHFRLKGRHLLSLKHHEPAEIIGLLGLAAALKAAKKSQTEVPYLMRKSIALIFEKTSTRTRCAFEVAAHDQGASVTFIDSSTSQMGHKESIKDTARVLGRMYDAIQYRGYAQSTVETLAAYAGVPVFNGLTDAFHPTQMLADVLTMQEHCDKPLSQIAFAYVGDARNNMAHSLLLIAAKLGMDCRIAAPAALLPDANIVDLCQTIAQETGARLSCTTDVQAAVHGVDFIHTDVWVSMGEPIEAWDERIDLLLPYQVNEALVAAAANPSVKIMHCLPAFHNADTTLGQTMIERYPHLRHGIEMTEAVFESAASIVFDQAENRLHTIKAVMVASLAEA
jgi:ornithine carbamoyltransferase